jgi:hypothetical protein
VQLVREGLGNKEIGAAFRLPARVQLVQVSLEGGQKAVPRGEFRDRTEAAYFAATTNPRMIASISDDCAAAWSASPVMVS